MAFERGWREVVNEKGSKGSLGTSCESSIYGSSYLLLDEVALDLEAFSEGYSSGDLARVLPIPNIKVVRKLDTHGMNEGFKGKGAKGGRDATWCELIN